MGEQLRQAFYCDSEIKKQLDTLKSRSEKENIPFSISIELAKKILKK